MKKTCPRCQGCGTIDTVAPEDAKKTRLIEKGHDYFRRYQRPPTKGDWDSTRGTEWPSYQTCVRYFGSWDNYIAACGWEARGRGRPLK